MRLLYFDWKYFLRLHEQSSIKKTVYSFGLLYYLFLNFFCCVIKNCEPIMKCQAIIIANKILNENGSQSYKKTTLIEISLLAIMAIADKVIYKYMYVCR